MPSIETSPAARPCWTERATINSTAGPGVSNSTTDATTNNPHNVRSGINFLLGFAEREQAISRPPRQEITACARPGPSRSKVWALGRELINTHALRRLARVSLEP